MREIKMTTLIHRRVEEAAEAAHRSGLLVGEAGDGGLALGHPEVLLGADPHVQLEMMVADRFLGEGDLAVAARFEISQEGVADSG